MKETTIVKTTDELLALRDSGGAIRTEGNLRIECDVPYSVGKNIAGIDVRGNLYVRGYLDVRGNLYVRGISTCAAISTWSAVSTWSA